MLGQRLQTIRREAVGSTLLLLLTGLVGCTDVRDYTGTWQGSIVTNQYLRRGLKSGTQAQLVIEHIDRSTLTGFFTLIPSSGSSTAGFTDATLIPDVEAGNDVLGDLEFDGDPLSTYIFYARPDDPGEDHAMLILSAHSGDELQLRILRHDLYGYFRLRR